MTTKEHTTEFLKALRGGPGDLDAWLECHDEADCKAAINGALEDFESVHASDNALIFKALAQLEMTTRGITDLYKELQQRAK